MTFKKEFQDQNDRLRGLFDMLLVDIIMDEMDRREPRDFFGIIGQGKCSPEKDRIARIRRKAFVVIKGGKE